jgi:hypothetical protein
MPSIFFSFLVPDFLAWKLHMQSQAHCMLNYCNFLFVITAVIDNNVDNLISSCYSWNYQRDASGWKDHQCTTCSANYHLLLLSTLVTVVIIESNIEDFIGIVNQCGAVKYYGYT